METTVERLIKLINNRSRNSLKTVFNDEEKEFWLEMEGIKKEILEFEEYSEKEYYRNKYLAKIFRKERNFSAALKYYSAAHIHKNYMQLIFKDTNQ